MYGTRVTVQLEYLSGQCVTSWMELSAFKSMGLLVTQLIYLCVLFKDPTVPSYMVPIGKLH